MKKHLIALLCSICLLSLFGMAEALVINQTLGEFSSPYHDPGTYSDEYLVGTFNYNLTGNVIVSAMISGQWGNSISGSTAHNKLYVDNLLIADTHDYTPDPYNNTVPWSYTFSDFSTLNDGIADFKTIQTSEYYVRLGETTLHIEAKPVPEPASLLLIGSGLIGLVKWGKKKIS